MSKFLKACASGVLTLGMMGLLAGCKSAPELTKDQALALIQAQYDQQPPVSATIQVNDDGMKAGVTARYWDRSKAYPNRYWADFKLTAEGQKAVKLPDGGDTIQWRPESATDTKYTIAVNPVIANHLKAENVADPQDGAGGSKYLLFDEVTSLNGVPDPVKTMARFSHTMVTTRRTATFALENGAWKLQSVN
jgi:hypothetical protein